MSLAMGRHSFPATSRVARARGVSELVEIHEEPVRGYRRPCWVGGRIYTSKWQEVEPSGSALSSRGVEYI